MRTRSAILAILVVAGCGAQAPGPGPRHVLARPAGPGSFFLSGGGEDQPALLARFLDAAGGAEAPVVVVPFAAGEPAGERYRSLFTGLGAHSITVLTGEAAARARELAAVRGAWGLFFTGGIPDKLLTRFAPFVSAAREAWRSGCVLGGHSAGTMALGSRVITDDTAALTPGFGLLAGTILDPHFGERARLPRLYAAVVESGALGLGIDADTAAWVQAPGTLEAVGAGTVTVLAKEGAAARVVVLERGEQVDLRAWGLAF